MHLLLLLLTDLARLLARLAKLTGLTRLARLARLAELTRLARLADLPRLALGGLLQARLTRLGLLLGGEHRGWQGQGGGGDVQKFTIHRKSSFSKR